MSKDDVGKMLQRAGKDLLGEVAQPDDEWPPRGLPPSPVSRFFEGGRVSQILDGVSKTLFDST